MKDRIIQLMESQHMNQQSFSNFIGINPATLNSILKERTRPTLNIVEAICEKMPRVSMTWLVKGQGDMYLPDPTVHRRRSQHLLFHPLLSLWTPVTIYCRQSLRCKQR